MSEQRTRRGFIGLLAGIAAAAGLSRFARGGATPAPPAPALPADAAGPFRVAVWLTDVRGLPLARAGPGTATVRVTYKWAVADGAGRVLQVSPGQSAGDFVVADYPGVVNGPARRPLDPLPEWYGVEKWDKADDGAGGLVIDARFRVAAGDMAAYRAWMNDGEA